MVRVQASWCKLSIVVTRDWGYGQGTKHRTQIMLSIIYMAVCPSILQWNARSIASKLPELQYYLASTPVPILAISEGRLPPGS